MNHETICNILSVKSKHVKGLNTQTVWTLLFFFVDGGVTGVCMNFYNNVYKDLTFGWRSSEDEE